MRTRYGYIEDARTMIDSDDTTVENVRRELERSLRNLDGLDGSVVPFEQAPKIADTYNALDHLTRWLPEVQAWVCGYFWGRERAFGLARPWSSWSGHATEEEAKAQLPHWIEQEAGKWDASHRTGSEWEVRFMSCDIGTCVLPGTDPKVVVEGCFR